MLFSVFLNARAMRPEDDRQLMKDLDVHALRAADAGFSAIFMPDHHFNGHMPVASDRLIFAADLAAKIPHVHFGFLVASVPLHHPVRCAERINILDQLTDGKLLVGIANASSP
jgi:alkanesulfonate monooxygenase SsuD/methylene tetrahydromethanopterin reductase-like flavin-dependent oxidoreductase (luciferase family)